MDISARNSAISGLRALEDALIRKARSLGVNMRRSNRRIEAHLSGVEPLILTNIHSSLTQLLRSMVLAEAAGVSPFDDVEFFKLSMRDLKLTYPPDFLGKVGQEDIIEGYDMNRRQIFRNMRFMQISGYSLMEVLSYDWPMLFDRPSRVTQIIIQQTEQDMWSANRTIESQVPVHMIREILAQDAQVCEVEHRLFSPLYAGPGTPGGMLSVSRAKLLAADTRVKAPDNISFI